MTAWWHLVRGLILGLVIWIAAPLAGGPVSAVLGVEQAQAQTVRAIDITGNQRVSDTIIVSFLSVGVGDVATPQLINASIDSLHESGLFKTVNVTMSGSTLRVAVEENPIVSGVLFTGNKTLSDSQLLALVDLAALGVYSDAAVERGARAIRAEYASKGYSNVDVSWTVEVTESGRIRVTYQVVEGYRAKIASITFTGNDSISGWNLRTIMKTRQSHLLSWLLRDDIYDKDLLSADEQILRNHYADHGFPDAQVSSVVEFDEVRGAYFITINIVEGDRYTFGQIGVETSIDGINTNALTREIATHQGGRYSDRALQQTMTQMALVAADMGYPFADVRPRIDRDVANKQFNITYLVDRGVRLYVERINIYGNEKTRDFVIRREIPFAEGDPFNRALLAAAKQNLDALQYFKSVSINIQPGSAFDKVIINLVVVENSTGEYAITAGYSSNEGVVGELSLTERNFLGRGQFLRIALNGGLDGARTFSFQFTEPRFMGLRISKGIELYQRVEPEGSPLSYGTEATGGVLRVGLPVLDGLSASVFAGYETKSFVDDGGTAAPDYIPVGGSLNKAFIGHTLTYSTLDNQSDPSSGFYGQLEQSYVGIDHNLLKSEVRARYYLPVARDYGVVGSVRGQAGIINDFSGSGVNPTEGFPATTRLVRGFVPNDFGPRTDQNGDAIGFTEYAGLSAEFEFPIPMLPEAYGVSGALWADAAWVGASSVFLGGGNAVAGTSVDVPILSSAGASVIWDSPLGPLRGDFAYVISKATDDKTQVFQLTLQSLF